MLELARALELGARDSKQLRKRYGIARKRGRAPAPKSRMLPLVRVLAFLAQTRIYAVVPRSLSLRIPSIFPFTPPFKTPSTSTVLNRRQPSSTVVNHRQPSLSCLIPHLFVPVTY